VKKNITPKVQDAVPATRPVIVETYAELERYALAFAQGHLRLVVIIGCPGVGKSRTVLDALRGQCCLISGAAIAFDMYSELFWHCDEPVIIDDVDSLYRDHSAVRLLKSLCQSEEIKTLMWKTGTTMRFDSALPSSFQTSSHVAIIANDWKRLNEDV
jgi:hypothetical protein